MAENEKRQKNLSRLGISSLLLSTFGFGIFVYCLFELNPSWMYLSILPGCAGIILAISGLISISRKHDKLRGRPYCIAAILIFMPCIFFIGVSEFCVQTRIYFERTYTGIPKLRTLSAALLSYASSHHGLLPDANSWCDELLKNDPNLTQESFKNPRMGDAECGFAFNENLSRKPIDSIPKRVVLLFEASGQWNLSGSQELLNQQKSYKPLKIVFVDSNMVNYWLSASGERMEGFYNEPILWLP